MTTHNRAINNPTAIATFLVGQASIWWGLAVAIGYDLAFAVLMPHASRGMAGAGVELPLEWPAVGLGLGGFGLLLARRNGGAMAGYPVAGLIINVLPLTLAVVLRAFA